tara:strand:- start:379 stop:609 length:231 start_codon:yes stop_codon:yes gene_type:complete
MKNYFNKSTLSIFSIILFIALYIGIGSSNNCWVCEGDGKNNCIVCINGNTEMGECVFCDEKGKVICTFCDGTGLEI